MQFFSSFFLTICCRAALVFEYGVDYVNMLADNNRQGIPSAATDSYEKTALKFALLSDGRTHNCSKKKRDRLADAGMR